jgi:hypothetical protein
MVKKRRKMVVVAARRAEDIASRCAPAASATVLGPTSGSKGKGQDDRRDTAFDAAARGGEGGKVGACACVEVRGSDGSCGSPTGEQREREGWKAADGSTWRQGPLSASLLRGEDREREGRVGSYE